MELVKFEVVSIRNHSELNEKWVQDRIAEDPSILGLGDIVLKDRERTQPRAGRLDLLLQDADSNRRYEVEIQLGATDESHLVRTIEYWDIERKRYPQYDHTAVIVAEDITSRFLNVINLFSGMVPLVAIQMKALQTNDQMGLFFTTVIDHLAFGLVEEDEGGQEPTDRSYWESRGSKKTAEVADQLLEIAKVHDPDLGIKRPASPDITLPGSAWERILFPYTSVRRWNLSAIKLGYLTPLTCGQGRGSVGGF